MHEDIIEYTFIGKHKGNLMEEGGVKNNWVVAMFVDGLLHRDEQMLDTVLANLLLLHRQRAQLSLRRPQLLLRRGTGGILLVIGLRSNKIVVTTL